MAVELRNVSTHFLSVSVSLFLCCAAAESLFFLSSFSYRIFFRVELKSILSREGISSQRVLSSENVKNDVAIFPFPSAQHSALVLLSFPPSPAPPPPPPPSPRRGRVSLTTTRFISIVIFILSLFVVSRYTHARSYAGIESSASIYTT